MESWYEEMNEAGLLSEQRETFERSTRFLAAAVSAAAAFVASSAEEAWARTVDTTGMLADSIPCMLKHFLARKSRRLFNNSKSVSG
jgi:uncharacterized protein (DUF2147 family)